MITGVRWLSIGPGSGYGNTSEDYLSALRSSGVPVTWTPIGWPSDTWDAPLGPIRDFARHRLDGARHIDIAHQPIQHDTVVVHSTPLWEPQLAAEAAWRRLVAYTTWETDRLPPDWVSTLNRYDRVLVPSRFNAAVFASSGVTVPLVVVPHIARRAPVRATEAQRSRQRTFVFYLIATWTTRKAILDAVSAYVSAFTADDDVALVIHTTAEDQIAIHRLAAQEKPASGPEIATWSTLARALAGRRTVPKIALSTRRLSQEELDHLHGQGDCFVLLSRGEGWGLGAFHAGAAGNPAIITGWGGGLDFLPEGYPYCVDYDLVPTLTDEPDAWWGPREGEHWAKARIAHAAELMRHVFEHRHEAREWGLALQSEIQARFGEARVTARLLEALG